MLLAIYIERLKQFKIVVKFHEMERNLELFHLSALGITAIYSRSAQRDGYCMKFKRVIIRNEEAE